VNVDASKSTDDTGISSYEWSWGDDTISTGPSNDKTATHVYELTDTYEITLTVTDIKGAKTIVSDSVHVIKPNVGPKALF